MATPLPPLQHQGPALGAPGSSHSPHLCCSNLLRWVGRDRWRPELKLRNLGLQHCTSLGFLLSLKLLGEGLDCLLNRGALVPSHTEGAEIWKAEEAQVQGACGPVHPAGRSPVGRPASGECRLVWMRAQCSETNDTQLSRTSEAPFIQAPWSQVSPTACPRPQCLRPQTAAGPWTHVCLALSPSRWE